MFETIFKVLSASWDVLLESSLYVLFGFFIAGMLKAFIPDNFIQKHLGKGKISSVFKASLFGIPIPLCSCGVIPAAAGLREQGASKGAISSFMISTPETGVDSIAVTYALLDPVMTFIRPVSAFFTAAFTGIAVNIFDHSESVDKTNIIHKHDITVKIDSINRPELTKHHEENRTKIKSENRTKINSENRTKINSEYKSDNYKNTEQQSLCSDGCCSSSMKKTSTNGVKEKFKIGMDFAFGELLGDIGPWLLVGIILAGTITVYITPEFIESYLGDGIFSMVIMIAIATPLYVCATASTPIAAALALKGLSPGAALVFLLAGPATNIATITVLSKLLGKKTTAIYLVSIMGYSLIIGMLTNWIYGQLGLDITGWVHSDINESHGIVAVASSVVLLILVLKPVITKA
ncbi:MAG: SO_0444 family Cu/Zn efflux transporter, partial [Desulfamplus sp.]|nr:SO_0444 family Cu/Zn efflux transporter [Desulfamplus sp.]